MKNYFLISAALFSLNAYSQSNTVSAGGDAEGDNGSVSYSIGQVVYTSAQGSNGNINQGVQQPYDVGVVTGIEEVGINLSVFPNPTAGILTLNVADEDASLLSYQLYDAAGRLIDSKNKLNSTTTISLEAYATGVYTLAVSRNNKQVKSFRVVRNY
ncbi:MAG: T9SS type A sorting domain-containing protein [Bacteroidia bacterium]|jgi:hypothetical protein